MESRNRAILLVEDENEIREALEEILSAESYAVKTACNGQEALDCLQSTFSPALILLDLMMPVLDGWELLRRLEKDPKLALFPVIIMSAANEQRRPQGRTFIRKPIDLDDLLQKIAQVVG